MIEKKKWDELSGFIQNKQRLLITCHVHPDGDAIGSQIALAVFLKQQGKEIHLLNMDATPKYFQGIDSMGWIKKFEAAEHSRLLETLDGAIVVDVSDWERLREIGRILRRANIPIACIDHHLTTDTIGTVQIADITASSTGELLYQYLVFCRADFTQQMINALYASILTDTGSFRFSNTTALTHEIAADLLKRGADFQKIYGQIYESESKNRVLLKGLLLAGMHFEFNDRLAWFALSSDLLLKTGAELWETENFSELPRTIETVEISLMFTENPDGTVKISFRSKGQIPINGLATQFGGGGHKFASGATVSMKLQEAIQAVLKKTENLFQEHDKSVSFNKT